MKFDFMWVWWFLTVAICVWKIGEGFVRPHRMLEWPFLASAVWAYFYGYMAYVAKTSLAEYLINDISNIGQLMPLLCLIGILIGWAWGTQGGRVNLSEMRTYPYFRFWLAGACCVVVGAAGNFSVMRAAGEGTLNFQESSGYWYLLFYVGYPGLVMMTWSLFKMNSQTRIYLGMLSLLLLAVFMYPQMANARRGPLFPAIMVLLLVPSLTRKRAPNPIVFCGILATAGLVMLLFLQVRTFVYSGGTWGDAIQHLSLTTATEERAKQPEDNEYINNCQLIGSVYEKGKYQYGTGHLSLLAHWIPRAIWKNKPILGQGNYSYDELYDDVEQMTGVRLLGSGAASGGVADTFVQYGPLCPLFWLGLSWALGRVYVRARYGNNPAWLFAYVGFMCGTHWLTGQGVAAAFVPGACFQVVPLVVFMVLGRGAKPLIRTGIKDARRSPSKVVRKQPVLP
jgi:hypothetical protein